MDTSTIVWIIVAVLAAVVLVGLLAYFARKGRDRGVVRRRETAAHADADRRAADEKRAEARGLFEKTKDAAQERTNRR